MKTLSYRPVIEIEDPVYLTARPGDSISYVVTQDGRVWLLEGDERAREPALDIRRRVLAGGERGLLGMAFHPDDQSRVFLYYTANDGDGVLSEYRFESSGVIDPDSEDVILRFNDPASNHNGGMLQFGPDGFLYFGNGDGGGAGDTFDNGQRKGGVFAKLLRFDVGRENPEPDIWAVGLRNPWRFWIDGDLIYIGDVGQNEYEEIDVAPIGKSGINYGWPIVEGKHCFVRRNCDENGLQRPVVEISHNDAKTCSVTGGVVYRGSEIPELSGHYFYSDYCGGYLRSFVFDGEKVTDERDWTDDVGNAGNVTSFGVDGAGEVYVLTTTEVLKIIAKR